MIAPPLTDEFYVESYQLRKEASTMTTAFITWFKENSKKFVKKSVSHSPQDKVFSILSVGSGEGDVDLEIIQSVIPHLHSHRMRLKYVAIDPNPIHCQHFQEKLQKISDDDSIEIDIQNGYFGKANQIDNHKNYDLLVMAHVLYYFQEPYQAIQQALAQIKSTGAVVLVHQEESGIPQIQHEYMMDVKGDLKNLLTAESIKTLLTVKGHHYDYQSVDARLDITECLASSQAGIKIMSFCLECDLRGLPHSQLKQLSQAFQSSANFTKTGRAFIDEPIGIFVMPSLPNDNCLPRVTQDHDPTQDYWQLATHFHWSDLLSPQTGSEPLRILDVACGTGRWLQALQHYVKFGNDNATIIYDLLEPNQTAMIRAIENLQYPFQLGQQYISRIQDAEPEQNTYDLLWSIHGFYIIPWQDMAFVLRKCLELLKTTGIGLIALATRQSFYVDFYDQYLTHFHEGKGVRFTSAEDVVENLSICGIQHHVHKIFYEEPIDANDRAALEHYIKNEATTNSFNKDEETEQLSESEHIFLDELLTLPEMKRYLNSFTKNSTYYFPQEIWLIYFYGSQS